MTMFVASFGESHEFFHRQESDDPGQHPHPNHHVLHVVVSVFVVTAVVMFVAVGVVGHMIVLVVMVMMMMMMRFLAVVVREHGVGNEMQESVAEKAPRSETQKHFEEARMLLGVL